MLFLRDVFFRILREESYTAYKTQKSDEARADDLLNLLSVYVHDFFVHDMRAFAR